MPFFTFTNFSRAQVAEKKPIVIGPFVERCTPADLENRIRLIPLEDAQRSNTIKLRSVIPYPDSPSIGSSTGNWEDDPSFRRQPSTLCRQSNVQNRSVSGSSTATTSSTDSVDTWTADCSLLPEVFNYYVCHKRAPPAEPMMKDDCEDSGDLTIDSNSSEWFEISMDNTKSLEVEVPVVVSTLPQKSTVRPEKALIPLEMAFLRADIRFRPEAFELEC
ncbi:hypothetical protein BDY19DRAFT_909068 [Irpex rosettiformis]|uniref:Uncharacterized protein n=1 Tax=Irpex rosettiformis TaxID=378272 RepID=A0ACB8TTV8_9APHY|nr:hypothetical protein BDY19DRAFT_909068 [Irpex rosettiformis]